MKTAFNKFTFYLVSVSLFWGSSLFVSQFLFESVKTVETDNREPSSIQKVYDYSDLVGSDLLEAAKDRLANSIEVSNSSKGVYLQIGNFVLLNDKKQKDFACGYYNKMSFEFEAEGVFVEGEKPNLTIQTGCDIASNINFMAPIKVPVAELKAQKPNNTEFKFYDAGRSMTITVNHSPSEWPSQWVLKNVKMINTRFSSRILQIPTTINNRGRSHQITMNW